MIRFIIFAVLFFVPLQAKEYQALPELSETNPRCSEKSNFDVQDIDYLLEPNKNFQWISMRQKNDFDYAKVNRNTIRNLSFYWSQPTKENAEQFIEYILELYNEKNFAKGVGGGDGIDNAGRYQPAIFALYFSYHALKSNGHLDVRQDDIFLEMLKSRSKNLFGFVNREAPHTYTMSRCRKGGDIFGCQNHTYDVQLTRLLYGITFNDQKHIDQGKKMFEFAINDLAKDGSLWREAQRGWWSWHYYSRGLNLLTLTAEIYKFNEQDIYSYTNNHGQTFHDAVKFLLDAMDNHQLMWEHSKKNQGIDGKKNKKGHQDLEYYHLLKFNGMDGHNGWAYAYVKNFPTHPNTDRIKNLIQLEDEIEWAHEGIDLGCFYPFTDFSSDVYEQGRKPNEKYDTEMTTKFSWSAN